MRVFFRQLRDEALLDGWAMHTCVLGHQLAQKVIGIRDRLPDLRHILLGTGTTT